MLLLIAGLVLFFGPHLFSALRSRAKGKDLRTQIGEPVYMGAYSVVALAGLVMIIFGYGDMRPAPALYAPPIWAQHLNYILMPLALIALAAAYLPTGYIKKALKHPMLVAIKIWAVGHLLANGEINAIILFGAFLAFAVIDRIAAKRRGDIGPAPGAPVSIAGDIGAVIIGLGATAALIFWLHPILFGVSVLPA